MKKVVFENTGVINFSALTANQPIFAKKDGKLVGMLVNEDEGWILRIGGTYGSYGYEPTLEKCIKHGMKQHGYEFFVEG